MRVTDCDLLLISRVLADGDLNTPLDAGLSSQFFGSVGAPEAWEWINKYRGEYGQVPSFDAFTRGFRFDKYEDFSLDLSVEDSMAALIDEVFSSYKHRVFREGLLEASELFDEGDDPDEALPVIQEMLSAIHRDTARSDIQISNGIVGDLVSRYVTMKENSMPGIPTGFKLIDETLGGFQKEQLITLVGLPKAMKSSYLLYMAMQATFHGRNVGLVSFEMSNAEQQARWLSLGAQVSLPRMQRGQLTDAEIERLHEFEALITETEGVGDLVFIHDVNNSDSVDGLIAKQEQHRFDALYVDGVYLMKDDLGEPKGSPQALTNITRKFKRFAQTARIPIACSTQALQSRTSRGSGVQMASVAYSSSFVQDSDVILGVDRNDMQSPVVRLKVVAARNAMGVENDVSIDYLTGKVSDRGVVTADDPRAGITYGGDDEV